ncbi:MAG: hypothetical protein ACK5QX_07580 [bacterium]
MVNPGVLLDWNKESLMKYLANAFSLGMVKSEDLPSLRFEAIDGPEPGCESIVGHADTAQVLGVPFNRASVILQRGDVMYVAQLQGGRLPEGCKNLPQGFSFTWVKVTLS